MSGKQKLITTYNCINMNAGKVILSQGIDNFKEIFEGRGNHFYITTFSYNLPEDYNVWLERDLEHVNDLIVVFNVFSFDKDECKDAKINKLIQRALRKNPYIQFFYNKSNHSKIVTNGNEMYIGSANVTDYTKNNFEVGVITKDQETIDKVEAMVFKNSFLQYEPIFTDPIAPIIVPFFYIHSQVEIEYGYIKNLLNDLRVFRTIKEDDLPDGGDSINAYLKNYLEIFKIAKNDFEKYLADKIEESFIIENLLDKIQGLLADIINENPIGSATNQLFDFIEDYEIVLEEYKDHYWRINTIEYEVYLLEEKMYLVKIKSILDLLYNLRVKWISQISSGNFIKYSNEIIPTISWLEYPELSRNYWKYFLK
ncbi:TPA: hypothetical protein ROX88_000570 [Bacillus pseudomycoides]|nr:hypothetical protein [Bacillus pseudomycoides]